MEQLQCQALVEKSSKEDNVLDTGHGTYRVSQKDWLRKIAEPVNLLVIWRGVRCKEINGGSHKLRQIG